MKVIVNEQTYYMDGIHKDNLDTAKKVITKDWDMLFIYDGAEGSGKSVKAMQDAFYCDPSLNIDRITFTPKEFHNAIMKAEKYQAVIYDEAYTGLSSRATMSLINRTLISMLAEIRQKNLFVFVVMPCFFDLDKYVALWRARALIHVYTSDNFERGFFRFYNRTRKKDLYINGKKYYNYNHPEPNFKGRFTNYYPIDADVYKHKKHESLMGREKLSSETQLNTEFKEKIFIRLMSLDPVILDKIPAYIRSEIIGITTPTYYVWVKKYQQNESFNDS